MISSASTSGESEPITSASIWLNWRKRPAWGRSWRKYGPQHQSFTGCGELVHPVLDVGAADRRRALGPQREAALALVGEGEHLLVDDVGALPDTAREQLGVLEHRRLDPPVTGAGAESTAAVSLDRSRSAARRAGCRRCPGGPGNARSSLRRGNERAAHAAGRLAACQPAGGHESAGAATIAVASSTWDESRPSPAAYYLAAKLGLGARLHDPERDRGLAADRDRARRRHPLGLPNLARGRARCLPGQCLHRRPALHGARDHRRQHARGGRRRLPAATLRRLPAVAGAGPRRRRPCGPRRWGEHDGERDDRRREPARGRRDRLRRDRLRRGAPGGSGTWAATSSSPRPSSSLPRIGPTARHPDERSKASRSHCSSAASPPSPSPRRRRSSSSSTHRWSPSRCASGSRARLPRSCSSPRSRSR